MQNVLTNDSANGLSVGLCLMTLSWVIYLLRTRQSGRARALLSLLGVVAMDQGYRLLCALGVWTAGNAHVAQCLNLSGAGLLFLAVYVVGRWGQEHRGVTTRPLVVAGGAEGPAPWGGASPELLAAALDALPAAISITDPQGKLLFQNRAAGPFPPPADEPQPPVPSTPQSWSMPIGHEAAGCRLQVVEKISSNPTKAAAEAGDSEAAEATGDPSQDRRRSLRLPTGGRVRVELLDGSALETRGEILDFSGEGIGLRLSGPVARGTAVLVRLGAALMLGRVKDCEKRSAEWRVGVEIEQFLAPSTPAVVQSAPLRTEAAPKSQGAWQPTAHTGFAGVTCSFGCAE